MKDIDEMISTYQQPMIKAPSIPSHPSVVLFASYASKGFLVEVGTPWPLNSAKYAINIGPYAPTLNPRSTKFVREEFLLQDK